ncbi:MAG: peptidoglycan-binding protein [Clostridia bacterium]|nr:peptidoglycan-binding protein [Clostridia bacterium]
MLTNTKLKENKSRRALRTLCLLLALTLCGSATAEVASITADAAQYMDDQSDSLRVAQQRLIDLGLLRGHADGAYGPKTEAALRAYQSQSGLEETGHLDAATLGLLTYVSPETASAKDVQQRLIDLGYLDGFADGIIGPRSVDALKMFQRLNGLAANGKAGSDTLNLLFSDAATALPASLTSGSKGDEVTALQRRLVQYGFMEGTPDGSYGQTTTAAVRSFQQHLIEQGFSEGITANGTATPLTQYCLYSGQYSTYLRDVTPGVADSEALRIERRLLQLGYMDLPADDVLDDYALSALKLFQRQGQMQPDALADRETIDALFSASAPVADHCALHDIASGDNGKAVLAVEQALVCGGLMTKVPNGSYNSAVEAAIERLHTYLQSSGDPSAALFADAKALSPDAQQSLTDGLLAFRTADTEDESEMLRIQCRLYSLYYLPQSGVDGKFGRNSRNALKEFQSENGLEVTGKADEATQNLLFSAKAQAKHYPYRIEVSIDRQAVDIYEYNQIIGYQLVKTFTCSTGVHNSTPRGIFLEGKPVNRWHHFKKFNCWAQYSYSIVDDIMFHSVIYSSNNENTLRSGSLYALGNPASHGCVRLQVEDAKWLFENCKRGTAVIVIY